ncbi:MAG: hypothetical protein R3F54_15210 [Alphaproteobacteria bacterium]
MFKKIGRRMKRSGGSQKFRSAQQLMALATRALASALLSPKIASEQAILTSLCSSSRLANRVS